MKGEIINTKPQHILENKNTNFVVYIGVINYIFMINKNDMVTLFE